MPIEVKTPSMGESVLEGTIGEWLKQEGEMVNAGEPLLTLDTEKVNVEVPAEQSGRLARILRKPGETVRVGEVLALLDLAGEMGEAAPETPAANPSKAAVPAVSPAPVPPATTSEPTASPATTSEPAAPTAPSAPSAHPVEVASSPSARKLAAETGADLRAVQGTGPHGIVNRQDLEATQRSAPPPAAPSPTPSSPAAQPPATPTAETPPGSVGERPEDHIKLSRRRLTIARRLVEAQSAAAMLTTFNDVDMSAVMEIRKRRRDSFKERYGVSLGFMSFFTRAVVGALKAFPEVNAEFRGEELILKRYYDIGVAVSTPGGLVVPVVRDADRKSFAEIEKEISDLARRARENKLRLDELVGGTFTITNGGVFGSMLSTPILNPPQVGILGMHRIEERPVARDGQVVIRPMMYLALTYDHRVIDGREAVQFLVRVKELIEDPETLLLEA